MHTGTGLTIRDYFNQAGFKARATGTTRKAEAGDAFARTLASAGGVSGAVRETPMNIQDYFKTPVRNRPVFPSLTPPADRPKVQKTAAQPASMTPPMTSPAQPQDPSAPENEMSAIEAGVHRAAARYDLSPALIRAVIKAESNYQTRAVSLAGAQGLMQLMPATAGELGVADPFDIEQNIDGGARYLRQMLDQFDGELRLALSAYNAGPGTVARYGGNLPPYAETRTYVARVLRYMNRYSNQPMKT